MIDNYIFSGIGHAFGEYEIDNATLEKAIQTEYLDAFNQKRIESGESFQKYRKSHPKASAFDFMAEYKMGFKTRNHVVPFPPNRSKYKSAANALDLAVDAVQMALDDAGIHPEHIGAWLVSTATPHEQAPGIAETLKAYFVHFDNTCETMTLHSACGGFNYNLERALIYLKQHPEAEHVVVCHTEVMSELLVDTTEFVPYVTFADGAAAVILSRIQSEDKEGLLDIVNYEDPQMINFLGATPKGRMYMQAGIIKDRATENLVRNSRELLSRYQLKVEDIDLMIPHQTGNAIVHGVVEALKIDTSKVYQEVQYRHGNLSGASIPASISLLKKDNRWKKGDLVLTATAGLGGENGAFLYKIPQKNPKHEHLPILKGKTAVVTGASGGIGFEVAKILAERGCNLILQYKTQSEDLKKYAPIWEKEFGVEIELMEVDFASEFATLTMADTILKKHQSINYIVHTAATTGSLKRATEVSSKEFDKVFQINQWSPIVLTQKLFPILKETILYVGSVAEDAEFSGSVAYVASKRGLHGFAGSFAPEAAKKGLKSIYYMPGMVDGGMAKYLDEYQIQASLMAIKQKQATPLDVIATRIAQSLYIPKVSGTYNHYEDVLTVRRDSYQGDNIHYSIQ
ncbi:MAG: SDR family NAD(P)-dependent oxidoreductase [Bacteroidales bacterium]|nr:SDR family NAD(P)-dependent oxidoreductase [Bacteroidales bacterium]